MLNRVICICGGVLLAGCASLTGLPITAPPADVTFANGVSARTIARLDLITVRTFQRGQGEVIGADCVATGTDYTAKFISPAVVRLPLYAGRTDDVFVRCSLGPAAGQDTLEAENLTAPENEGIFASVGTSGTRLGAVFSIRDRTKDRFNYDNYLRINLR